MTRVLDSLRQGPESGQSKQIVVFLHGYGANAEDLMGIADTLAPHMPDTVFVAPDAPEQSLGNPMGFQWFPVPWLDGSPQDAAEVSRQSAIADLNAYLDQVLADEGLPAGRMILFGFSQGTMMALHVAPRRADGFAGVVGFSGRIEEPELLADETLSRPPVLLVHGDQDDMIPPENLQTTAQALQDAGFDVYAHIMEGTGHGIAPDGLGVALAFMRERFGLE